MQTDPQEHVKQLVRYGNRKLYDSQSHGYITSQEILDLVRQGAAFKVTMSASDEDITAQTLCHLLWRMSRADMFVNEESVIRVIQEALRAERMAVEDVQTHKVHHEFS